MTHNHKHIPVTATFELVGDDHNEIRVTVHQTPEMNVPGVDDFLDGDTVLSFRHNSENKREKAGAYAIGMMVQTLLQERAIKRAEMGEEYIAAHPEHRDQIREAAIDNIMTKVANGELDADVALSSILGLDIQTVPNETIIEKDEGNGFYL